MLESVDQALLAQELAKRGIRGQRQVRASFDIDGLHIHKGLRVDLIVEAKIGGVTLKEGLHRIVNKYEGDFRQRS